MHIIQIRGTSGSGKSTCVKDFMHTSYWQGVYKEKRKQPLYYYNTESRLKVEGYIPFELLVLGHYESSSVCGGCDTFTGASSASKVFQFVQTLVEETPSYNNPSTIILMESLVLSEDVKWVEQWLKMGHRFTIFFLNTLPQECLKRLKSRREKSGRTTPIKESNTLNRCKVINRARLRLVNLRVSQNLPIKIIIGGSQKIKTSLGEIIQEHLKGVYHET